MNNLERLNNAPFIINDKLVWIYPFMINLITQSIQ